MPPITPPAIAPAEDELNINIRYAPLITLINEYMVTKMKKESKKKTKKIKKTQFICKISFLSSYVVI